MEVLADDPTPRFPDESSQGAVRLAIRDGRIAVGSLAAPGFASGAMPDFSRMTPFR